MILKLVTAIGKNIVGLSCSSSFEDSTTGNLVLITEDKFELLIKNNATIVPMVDYKAEFTADNKVFEVTSNTGSDNFELMIDSIFEYTNDASAETAFADITDTETYLIGRKTIEPNSYFSDLEIVKYADYIFHKNEDGDIEALFVLDTNPIFDIGGFNLNASYPWKDHESTVAYAIGGFSVGDSLKGLTFMDIIETIVFDNGTYLNDLDSKSVIKTLKASLAEYEELCENEEYTTTSRLVFKNTLSNLYKKCTNELDTIERSIKVDEMLEGSFKIQKPTKVLFDEFSNSLSKYKFNILI